MKVGFEEKTYENFFNSELDKRSRIYFPLGQVQEGFLGFDSSAGSRSRRLWRIIGHPFWFYPPFSGINLQEIAREMEQFLSETIDSLPHIRVNLLFQYKKPAFMKSYRSKEWNHWNRPYYRYDIYGKQQRLLNHINTHFGEKVLILYASPAAKNINELIELKAKGKIIDSSNFTKASDLNGHSRNTYISSGNHSIACSKPQKINTINIIEELEVLGNTIEIEKQSNRQIIIEFQKQISSIIGEDINFEKGFQLLKEDINKFTDYKLLHSFLIMNIFRQITGLQWLIKI